MQILVVMVDFLHVLGFIEDGFISSPNVFKQTLVSIASITDSFVNPSQDVLCLGVFGV